MSPLIARVNMQGNRGLRAFILWPICTWQLNYFLTVIVFLAEQIASYHDHSSHRTRAAAVQGLG